MQRLTRRNGYVYFPSARNVGRDPKLRTEDGALRLYGRMAKELASAGINLNFGPVVDLNTNPANPVIGRRKRSFGSDPKTVTELARAFIIAHRDANVLTSPKHFPGHGSSRSDSHKVLPDISRTWRESELDPYRLLAKEGLLDMVMVGHLYHPRFSDGETVPTSLSARAISALRAKGYIGFRGVVVSDDMEMGAMRKAYTVPERAVMAINAGTDIIVFSNVISKDAGLGPKIHATILDAVRDGRIYADCAGPDRHRAPAVCRLTVRGRLEGVGLRPGYDHHRSVPVGIFVGAISAEVLTMRWDDVSLTRAEWRIPHTKAGRPHLLPLPHALVAMLRSLPSVD